VAEVPLIILLDTSFLLPSFGVDTGDDVRRVLKFLAKRRDEVRVYYSRYSILEAVFILLREVRQGRLGLDEASEMAYAGVAAVTYGLEAVDESPPVFAEALKLYGLGHKDIFDDILYATAMVNGMFFLTVDRGLVEFIERNRLVNVALTPKGLEEKLEGRG